MLLVIRDPQWTFCSQKSQNNRKKFFFQKRIFEKQSPKIETGKKKCWGDKFESFQNRDPEDTSTIKIEFFLIRQRMVLPVLKHLGGSRGYRTVEITNVKWKEKQSYPFSRDRRGIKPHPLGSIYREMPQPVSPCLYPQIYRKNTGWPKKNLPIGYFWEN